MMEDNNNYINITEDDGIKKLIQKNGNGIKPSLNKEVLIKYIAKYNDKIYDDSSNTIYRFTIGKNEVIKGLEIAVLSMNVGEKSNFIIQPNYAYLNNNISSIIPKDAVIYLEIELIKIMEGQKDLRDMDYPEKIARAKQIKEKGSNKYKQNDFFYAKYFYEKAIKYLDNLDINDDEQEDGINLLCSILSNLCNCFNKLKDNNSVIEYATKGLNFQKLPKYYYFRAIAYVNKNEIDLALNDLDKLKELLKKDKKNIDDEGVKYILQLIENKKNEDIKENKKFSKNLLSHNKYS
jgi:tetratricopeptide (TPR) repeat protein